MNLSERTQSIFRALWGEGKRTIRALATATGIPKSSVHRHLKALERRQRYGESYLWETDEGAAWLKLLILGAIYCFGIKAGVGSDSLAEFFKLLHLDQRVACSASALRTLEAKLKEQIRAYGQAQAHHCQSETPIDICVGSDETFFESPILVLVELSTGFIFSETIAENRQYRTWLEVAQPLLNAKRWNCQYMVSDAAGALVKLALEGIGCPSIPDLFHLMRRLSRTIGSALARQLNQVETQLEQLQQTMVQLQAQGRLSEIDPQQLGQLSTEKQHLETAQETYHQALHQLSLILHPFAIETQGVQLALHLPERLEAPLKQLKGLVKTYSIAKGRETIEQFQQSLPALGRSIDAWWGWVCQALPTQTTDGETQQWVTTFLLPWCYWQQQFEKTCNPQLKPVYRNAAMQAHRALMRHPFTGQLSETDWQQWLVWGQWMSAKFQRTTSAVEGRNGCLSRVHHAGRGISAQTLEVLTIIHNFALKRSDGTTAAQRLFAHPFPDLFEWVFQNMGELPRPRRRPIPSSKMPDRTDCPALSW